MSRMMNSGFDLGYWRYQCRLYGSESSTSCVDEDEELRLSSGVLAIPRKADITWQLERLQHTYTAMFTGYNDEDEEFWF
ncbi:hypothetical protein JZ751_019736 [Albula glossodonta]|uniref:Uncharacterized protein n=1 Tax=Albula glossodonta TaxID=121402 RepID=A0A8T2MU86_9TELE|nr:hypothetical protein JZ751_019736 [Albula glossodonta]